jgi:5-oxopent-3-ene-1,2,5-tricarboxylate decarboxylase/2-hydroxyhepta-2,4-diene-1,7-dioate isomerase
MRRARVASNGIIQYAFDLGDERIKLADGRICHQHEVDWLPPIEPRTTIALGLNYADHAKELAFKAPSEPLAFLKPRSSFVGHRSRTVRPDDAAYMHYECELAVVIGQRCRNISEAQAYQHVAGYTVANDYAIRDYLENYYRPNLPVKGRDTCTPLGPWLVTADEIPDPMNLRLSTSVNGVVTQQGNTRDMIFSIPALIAWLSSFMTLDAGDLILTGTPEGLADTPAGAEVVTEIEQVGRLVNTIVNATDYYAPGQRG